MESSSAEKKDSLILELIAAKPAETTTTMAPPIEKYQDDCLEIWPDPTGQRRDEYHLIINSDELSMTPIKSRAIDNSLDLAFVSRGQDPADPKWVSGVASRSCVVNPEGEL